MKLPKQSEGDVIYTKVVGVSFGDRQKNLCARYYQFGDKLWWKFDEGNQYDANAISVYADEAMTMDVGHLPRPIARQVRQVVKDGKTVGIYVKKITGLRPPKLRGLNIVVRLE